MKNLLAAINTKITGSSLATSVGNRFYLDSAPDGATFPYVVFSIVSGYPMDAFVERVNDITIQFSLFSTSSGLLEIGTMYDYLVALFDDATFAVSGDTLLMCKRENMVTMLTDITTSGGAMGCRHWAIDYRMLVQD